MKKFLPFFSVAFLFIACNSKSEQSEIKSLQAANQSAAKIDTAGLAKFQQWQAQNELAAINVQEENSIVTAPVKEITVIRERIVERQRPIRPKSTPKQETPILDNNTNTGSGESEEVAGNSESTNEAKEPVVEAPKKEGWSKAAKGAVIGGAGGAVLGAIINKKNPAVGAAIGGVLGGAVGYGIGRGKDKKDGRY